MTVNLNGKLIVAISSRALFDLNESNTVWENDGEIAYQQYQITNEDNILDPGPAFPIVKKLLNLKQADNQEALVEVILLSRNSADTGLRIFNSIQAHQLNITRAAFTRGRSPYRYARAFGSHLFLSANINDVQRVISDGIAAATMVSATPFNTNSQQLRIAFDGDAVIFSDEAERVFQEHDLETFKNTEQDSAKTPLGQGPFKSFLETLHQLQKTFTPDACPIRTALITARNAPAHERAIRTLRAWDIRTDEAIFLGGMDKTEFIREFGADIFFDDQSSHCERASQHVATGHVPHGVVNEC